MTGVDVLLYAFHLLGVEISSIKHIRHSMVESRFVLGEVSSRIQSLKYQGEEIIHSILERQTMLNLFTQFASLKQIPRLERFISLEEIR